MAGSLCILGTEIHLREWILWVFISQGRGQDDTTESLGKKSRLALGDREGEMRLS